MSQPRSQSQILEALGIKVTPLFKADLSGNGLLQRAINQQAALKGLPQPFSPSLASTIAQDVLPLAALAGGAALGDTAAAGEAGTAGEAAGAGAGGGAAGTGLANLGTLAKTLGGAAVAAEIWAWLTTPGNWIRLLEFVAGAVFIFWGVKQLAGGTR